MSRIIYGYEVVGPVQSAITALGGGATVSGFDHGQLGQLSDDDHAQYILADGTRSFTGSIKSSTSGTLDIGSAALPFKDVYMTGASLYMNGSKVLYTSGNDLVLNAPSDLSFTYSSGEVFNASGNEIWIGDLNSNESYYIYNRSVDDHRFYIGDERQVVIDSTGIQLSNPITVNNIQDTTTGAMGSASTDDQLVTAKLVYNHVNTVSGSVSGPHPHVEAEITDLDKYTTAEVDAIASSITASGVSGWFDDGSNFRCTVTDGLITDIVATVSGGFMLS